jgi:hypothetical protein
MPTTDNLQRVSSLQRADDAAIGSVLVGGGLAILSAWLWTAARN